MDVVAHMVQQLLNDEDISALIGDAVYGEVLPADSVSPCIRVGTMRREPATPPAMTWWSVTLAIDVNADTPSLSYDIAELVQKLVFKQAGAYSDGVIADAMVESTTFFEDGSWTPTRYRNVVTVSVTARD